MGRIETVMLADKSSLILWLEIGTAENVAGIYARRLFPDGKLSAPCLVADTAQARASGFPRAALRPNGHVVMSWTHTGESTQVKTLAFDPTVPSPGRKGCGHLGRPGAARLRAPRVLHRAPHLQPSRCHTMKLRHVVAPLVLVFAATALAPAVALLLKKPPTHRSNVTR